MFGLQIITGSGDGGDEFQRSPPLPSLLYTSRRKFLASAGKSCLEAPAEFQTRKQARRKQLQQKDRLFESHDEEDDLSFLLPKNANNEIMIGGSFASYYQRNRTNSLLPGKKDLLQNILPAQKKSSVYVPDKESLAAKRMRRAGRNALGIVVLDSNDFDPNQENWREESKAGVTYWIHCATSEIVTECPWLSKRKSLIQLSHSRKRLVDSPMTGLGTSNDEFDLTSYADSGYNGTGSLVYDRSEVDELFQLLDNVHVSKSFSTSNSPTNNHVYPSSMTVRSI